MTIFQKWTELANNRINEGAATVTSGTIVADSFIDSFTLADWSTILGMIYIGSMLIPRLYSFAQWVKEKWEKRHERKRK